MTEIKLVPKTTERYKLFEGVYQVSLEVDETSGKLKPVVSWSHPPLGTTKCRNIQATGIHRYTQYTCTHCTQVHTVTHVHTGIHRYTQVIGIHSYTYVHTGIHIYNTDFSSYQYLLLVFIDDFMFFDA